MAQEKEQSNNQDVLEVYPEKEQVDAFPERRYIKLTRFLTIVTIINLAFVIAYTGIYFYLARHKDITLQRGNYVHLYSIDPERKLLLPAEPTQIQVSPMQLAMEKALRQYIEERYTLIFDTEEMNKRWGENGYVKRLSKQEILTNFNAEVSRSLQELRQNRITRDVHIYSLYLVHGDLWSAYIETFDFPLDENLKKVCDCMDNSKECLKCKMANAIKRDRKKILMRANFSGVKNCTDLPRDNPKEGEKRGEKICNNPLGIMVYAYYPAYVPIPKDGEKKETYWDLPPALRNLF